MTETEVHVEAPQEDLAGAIAEAQLEVARTLQQEAEIEQTAATAESALEVAIQNIQHTHEEYATVEHTHSEYEFGERINALESRISSLEVNLEEPVVEETVETIDPVEEPKPPTESKPKRRHRFGG